MKRASWPKLYDQASLAASKEITRRYSTSFSLGIRLFDAELRDPIYAIYGFVRLADEIVDGFKDIDAAHELNRFRAAYTEALSDGYSFNPVLHAFIQTSQHYAIDPKLAEAFLDSMAMDTTPRRYDKKSYERYIYGSAEAVGLMCLAVFCGGNAEMYERLSPGARALGSAFQKVNFLRDVGEDQRRLGRTYFPGVDGALTDADKRRIEVDIRAEFEQARVAVAQLPRSSRRGVSLALNSYVRLLTQIERMDAATLQAQRPRVANWRKAALLPRIYMS